MKQVLWVTNVPVSDAGRPKSAFGGWIDSGFKALAAKQTVTLATCFPTANESAAHHGETGQHHSFNRDRIAQDLNRILDSFSPDLIHIHGTEYMHSNVAASLARQRGIPSVVSIQGLVGPSAHFFYHGIPASARYGFTVRDLLRFDNTARQRKRFESGGAAEAETLRLASGIIGRTDWDRACSAAAAPDTPYFHCDETLRSSFYGPRWERASVRPHSILLSQSAYPIKGGHSMLEALPLVLRAFPTAHVLVAGQDPTFAGSAHGWLRRTSYGSYLTTLMKRMGIQNRVEFLGVLDEDRMRETFLSSHVFVLPSSIENSPNSLGEAMLLGMPSIAAYVGGIPSMTSADSVRYFPRGDHHLLADQIMKIFADDSAAIRLGQRAHEAARLRHDPIANAEQLYEIYTNFLGTA